jgi:hypothetical protein
MSETVSLRKQSYVTNDCIYSTSVTYVILFRLYASADVPDLYTSIQTRGILFYTVDFELSTDSRVVGSTSNNISDLGFSQLVHTYVFLPSICYSLELCCCHCTTHCRLITYL